MKLASCNYGTTQQQTFDLNFYRSKESLCSNVKMQKVQITILTSMTMKTTSSEDVCFWVKKEMHVTNRKNAFTMDMTGT